jgi:hypothetical protein
LKKGLEGKGEKENEIRVDGNRKGRIFIYKHIL